MKFVNNVCKILLFFNISEGESISSSIGKIAKADLKLHFSTKYFVHLFIQNSNIDAEATTTTKEDVIAMAARLSIASKVLLFNFSEEYKLFFF